MTSPTRPSPAARPPRPGLVAAVVALAAALTAAVPCSAQPAGWTHVPINDRKPRTVYQTGQDGDHPAVHATADASASLLMKPADRLDLSATPMVDWRWRVLRSPADADIAVSSREDAAARLVFVFDGDRARLPLTDRMVMAAADRLGSRPMPYATLMYVTSTRHPVGSVVPNPYTGRVRMLVVDAPSASGMPGWRSFRRDLAADFRLAFGEPAGRLVAWGVMSDSDNTRSRAEAWYTEPRFLPR